MMGCVKRTLLKNYLIYLLFTLQFHIILDSKVTEDFVEPKQEHVVVRAVFINCEPISEEQGVYSVNEASRFQREELFKHSVLQNCRKKLALTLKIVGEPEVNPGDEYIPIEHVFDGSNKRRVRLLDPYILRLRRESPLQAYKLRRLDTVVGVIAETDDSKFGKIKKNRVQRQLDTATDKRYSSGFNNSLLPVAVELKEACDNYEGDNTSSSIESGPRLSNKNISFDVAATNSLHNISMKTNENVDSFENIRVKREGCTRNSPAWRRDKRHEHNIIVEDNINDDKMQWIGKDPYYQHVPEVRIMNDKPSRTGHIQRKSYTQKTLRDQEKYTETRGLEDIDKGSMLMNDHPTGRSAEKSVKENHARPYDKEKTFALYEIGKPDLWYTVHVQLFEKMSTPEGKTVWNDITKGEIASVSSVEPEWTGSDINVKYRPTEWVSKNEFILPTADNLCLLVPTHDDSFKGQNEEYGNLEKYIVVPKEDLVSVGEKGDARRSINYSSLSSESAQEEVTRRKVMIRMSRSILQGEENKMKIKSHGSDRFLVLSHQHPYHAQIDVEARADQNELIRIGSSGSLITIVADNTRRTRSTITVQAMNRGLAAARFKVKTRDCGPEMADLIEKSGEGLMSDPVLLAPRHTHRFRLELPIEIPMNVARCSVALINDDEESIAVREVAIKKGDRCFCVWHCDCVCLNEDPKLQCREMTEARQVSAGLSPRERLRRARSTCYPDVFSVNLFVIVVGVLVSLLMMGLTKAVLGLFCRCIGAWGQDYIFQQPRKLERYYELKLRNRPVVYDEQGWPVHPDTMKRTVRLVSWEMEFAINIILFIVVPSMMLWSALKQLTCQAARNVADAKRATDTKKCFSTHDMQGLPPRWRRRRGGLRRWMTPQAEELSTDVWHNGLPQKDTVECEFMRPLLQERHLRADEMLSSCPDSEQDDTEYVLTQMQKSKESLAKSQKKMKDSEPSTGKKD